MTSLSNILAVGTAVKSRIRKISTQFVKWSVAVRIYLLPLSVSDKGPSMSVESLSRVDQIIMFPIFALVARLSLLFFSQILQLDT